MKKPMMPVKRVLEILREHAIIYRDKSNQWPDEDRAVNKEAIDYFLEMVDAMESAGRIIRAGKYGTKPRR